MKIVSLFVLLLSSVSAFAQSDSENCSLSGTIVLESPTTIMCTKDLNVAPGTQIITNGNPLQILVGGTANLADLKITSYPETTPPGFEASPIYLYARLATGQLEINNRGSSAADMGGEVRLEYTSLVNYDHTINVSETTVVEVTLNGLPYLVSSPAYKLISLVTK